MVPSAATVAEMKLLPEDKQEASTNNTRSCHPQAERYDGYILVTEEVNFQLQHVWQAVTPVDVQTPQEVFEELKRRIKLLHAFSLRCIRQKPSQTLLSKEKNALSILSYWLSY